ncbi:MAG: S8 family serine peptidase, partial [Lachnospiraceae bacterium]|nr:S8 family serine peptidase [Lachnospiraceae bacterium]
MNNLLEVKLRFNRESRKGIGGAKNLSKKHTVSTEQVEGLIEDLKSVIRYYETGTRFVEGFFVDVYYNDIVPKSNRIVELLKPTGRKANDMIVGARFSDAPEGQENHIITYYVDEKTIRNTISKLEDVKRFIYEELGGVANRSNFNEAPGKAGKQEKPPAISYESFQSKNYIRQLVVDCSVIAAFAVPNVRAGEQKEFVLITFFQAEQSVSDIMDKLKIDQILYHYSFHGKDTIVVPWELYLLLEEKIPYMISMISSDISKMKPEDVSEALAEDNFIPEPSTEPVIGVIDTFFDENAYFSKWVENQDYLDDYETKPGKDTDRSHGTRVSSIVVDGPSLNPWLDDGCGRFRVRHFGVCEERISVSRLVNKVRKIVVNNPDIHVWNLSLGTDDEVSKNYISYDAAALDELQAKHNVIFVISGTNDNRDEKKGQIRIGSPADSLNGLVVNSVRRDGSAATYSRLGTVLSFFNKPDVSYYGGDYEERERIYACDAKGKGLVYGTSFAAPWIARKMCYLVDVLGMTREVAKALIIDDAAGWA